MKPKGDQDELSATVPPNDLSLDVALLESCKNGDLDGIKNLVLAGANASTRLQKEFPLLIATQNGHEEAVEFLIEAGADINDMGKGGNTCLHLAVENNFPNLVETLMDKGASVNAANFSHDTPLSVALHLRQEKIAHLLLNSQTDLSTEREHLKKTKPLLCIAIQENMKIFVEKLLNLGIDPNESGTGTMTPLMMACQKGFLDGVRMLVEAGCDVNQSIYHISPLHVLAKHGGSDIAQYLIKNGALFEEKSNDTDSPVHLACRYMNNDVLKVFLEAKFNANSQIGNNKCTPLHEAIKCDNIDAIQELINYGANVNLMDVYEHTPLQLACKEGNVEAAQRLIEGNADVTVTDSFGNTCLHHAVEGGATDLVAMLLEKGVNPDCGNKKWNTPLIVATRKGFMNELKLLIDAKCNLDLANIEKEAALHEAARHGQYDIAEALIQAGADVDGCASEVNNHVNTPLILATMYRNDDIAWLLVKWNCDVSFMTSAGTCALNIALERRFYDVVRMFLLADVILPKNLKALEKLAYQRNDLYDYISEQLVEPPSLMRLCRRKARSILKRDFQGSLETVRLPKMLKHFVSLQPDLDKMKPLKDRGSYVSLWFI